MKRPWSPRRGATLVAQRFEVGPELGRGGAGRVFRAWDRRARRPVALKRLRRELEGDARACARFRREIAALSRLAHPHIVSAREVCRGDDGATYLVMELVEGEALSTMIAREGPLPPARVARVALMAARALAAAHAEGVTHRDVKPANLLLSVDGRGVEVAKLVDFGLARLTGAADEPTDLTGEGVIGTPHYMSPEQACGEAATAQSDLYALGALLYHALTGAPPHQGQSAMSVLYHHVHSPPRPPRDLIGGVPAWLDGVVLALLAKRPEDRPASAAELVASLRRHVDDPAPRLTPEAPGAAPPVGPSRRWTRRTSLGAALAGALALALGLLTMAAEDPEGTPSLLSAQAISPGLSEPAPRDPPAVAATAAASASPAAAPRRPATTASGDLVADRAAASARSEERRRAEETGAATQAAQPTPGPPSPPRPTSTSPAGGAVSPAPEPLAPAHLAARPMARTSGVAARTLAPEATPDRSRRLGDRAAGPPTTQARSVRGASAQAAASASPDRPGDDPGGDPAAGGAPVDRAPTFPSVAPLASQRLAEETP